MQYLLRRTVASACLVLTAMAVQAHDPSAYGGLFRSRDLGATWLNADVGLFLGGALSLAIDPTDPNHLLLGTDTGLLVSRNGGRAWTAEAPGKLFGPVFAVLFFPDGKSGLCVTPAGVYRLEAGEWQQASAPAEAAPARALVLGATAGRVYLVGRRELYRSDDSGKAWTRVEYGLATQPQFDALAVATDPSEVLYAVVDAAVMASQDGGASWRARIAGLPPGKAEGLSLDPTAGSRLWVAAANRLFASDDGGVQWRPVGEPLPEANTSVRSIAASPDGRVIVVTTHRGMYRSGDGGQTWALQEGNLPVHLEAGPLVHDPTHAGTLYAGYALMPYSEIWRRAVEGGNLLSRVDPVGLAGGAAFLLLLGIAGGLAARWLFRRRSDSSIAVRGSAK